MAARVLITENLVPRNAATLDSIVFTAADATNDHEFVNDGHVLLLCTCTDGSSKTVTIKSVPDYSGRSGDITVTVPATTGHSIIGPFKPSLFNQGGGNRVAVDITVATGLKFAAIRYQE